MKTILHNPPDC